jgi:hypothetical protein
MKKTIITVAMSAAALVGFAAPASAHHPELAATATCTEITVTAESWQSYDPARMVNLDVRVLVDDAQVGAGKFTEANGYRFVVKVPAKAGEYTVRVVARAPWGPAGEFGSAFEARQAKVVVPVCPELAAPLPKLERPVPIVETVVEAVVGTPTVVERAPVPAVVAGEVLEQPVTLAFTGIAMWQKVLAAVGALVVGAGALLAAKAVRSKGVRAV